MVEACAIGHQRGGTRGEEAILVALLLEVMAYLLVPSAIHSTPIDSHQGPPTLTTFLWEKAKQQQRRAEPRLCSQVLLEVIRGLESE